MEDVDMSSKKEAITETLRAAVLAVGTAVVIDQTVGAEHSAHEVVAAQTEKLPAAQQALADMAPETGL
jgi:hypothetical protein